ncbi:hypothetical protein PG987_016522 [Apiospora arundinis]
MADFAMIIGEDFDFDVAWAQQAERAGFIMEFDSPADQQAEIEALDDLNNAVTDLDRQVQRAEATLNDLPPVALQYAQYASAGVCSHNIQTIHQPEFVQAPYESDPTPIRVGSLRHDYYTALPEDADAAEALMDDDTLPPQQFEVDEEDNDNNDDQPVWRPEYNVCISDLTYHVNMYNHVPPARATALHLFKQCLISFVPAPLRCRRPETTPFCSTRWSSPTSSAKSTTAAPPATRSARSAPSSASGSPCARAPGAGLRGGATLAPGSLSAVRLRPARRDALRGLPRRRRRRAAAVPRGAPLDRGAARAGEMGSGEGGR